MKATTFFPFHLMGCHKRLKWQSHCSLSESATLPTASAHLQPGCHCFRVASTAGREPKSGEYNLSDVALKLRYKLRQPSHHLVRLHKLSYGLMTWLSQLLFKQCQLLRIHLKQTNVLRKIPFASHPANPPPCLSFSSFLETSSMHTSSFHVCSTTPRNGNGRCRFVTGNPFISPIQLNHS